MNKTLSISARLWLMALVVSIGTIALSIYTALAFYDRTMETRLSSTRTFVAAAAAVAQKQLDKVKAGQIDVETAQMMVVHEIRQMRYDGGEYIWINDMSPKMVMHPIKPELEGKDLSQNVDPNGKKLFVAFVDTVKSQGSGYVDYLWPKPGQQEPESKRSFVQGVPEWGWVIGSGVYIGEARSAAMRFAGVSVVASVLVSVFVIGLVASLVRSLRRRLEVAHHALTSIASGDLTVAPEAGADDEIGRLIHAIGLTRDGLRNVVREVRASTDSIADASAEIAVGNADLSHRTEQTASNLQQTASSVDQLNGTVQHSASSASQASQLANSASEVALRGGEVVSQVVSTMEDISASSRKIGDIIGVIDGIAFQTNILALNAAVEAARAGEQGRGFAVVASEVRNLAQRSADAAREIKTLISASVERVESGARLVGDAGTTMTDIVDAVRRVSSIVDEISTASTEQSHGIGQVNSAVTELDQMTQQNAALVEQSAAAAESLKEQARRLSDVVKTFRLEGSHV